jgi:two-component system sensor histidine kinase TctE
MTLADPPSLRGRLLRLLWWPLLAVLLLSAVYDYNQWADRARSNQDLALSCIAIALATRLDVDADDTHDDDLGPHLAHTVQAMQQADGRDRLFFAVQDAKGNLLGGDARLMTLIAPPLGDWAVFADTRWQGSDVRVVALPHRSPLGPVTVVVAETTERRIGQTHHVLVDTIVPNLVLVLLALGLVWLGVNFALAPLDRLSEQVGHRSQEDLGQIPESPLPSELKPLVAALNRLMAHLRASAQVQQAFLSNAAHQLRTPLAGVVNQIELVSREVQGEPRERLDSVQEALQRMTRSTHQMLALARSGPQAAAAEDAVPVDLAELLEDAASQWLDTALAAEVDLGFEPQPAVVRGSAWMLHELLGNLIHNALRHSPPGSRVTVRSGCDTPGGAWLEVEDEGPGIPPALRDKVFDRFFQAPGAAPGGSGLGLAIVREVAERHQAQVRLLDGADGRGLRVRVEFPATP